MWTSVNITECVYINAMSVQMHAYTLIWILWQILITWNILYGGLFITTFASSHKSRTNPVKSEKLLYFEQGLSIKLFPFLLLWHLAAIKTVNFFRNPWQIFCLSNHALIFHLWLMITVFHSFCDWSPFLGEYIFPLSYISKLSIPVLC